MKISAQIKQRIETKLREGIATIERHYKCKLEMPRILYNLGGGTAGRASYTEWYIQLNPILLMENLEDFIVRTVPHELAHLATDRIYPEAHNRGENDEAAGMFRMMAMRGRRFRRPKRELHGTRWQEIMRVLGVSDVTRCHQYDVSNVSRRKARHQYKCSGCGTVLTCGPKVHKQLLAKPDSRWHTSCRGSRLVLVGAQPKAPVVTVMATPVQPTAGTKQARAHTIYQALKNQYDRDGIIARFKRDLNMTPAGASTYYYNCQKMFG